jgi:hypothetical protein
VELQYFKVRSSNSGDREYFFGDPKQFQGSRLGDETQVGKGREDMGDASAGRRGFY